MSRLAGAPSSSARNALLLGLVYLSIAVVLALFYFEPISRDFTSKMIGDHPDRYETFWAMDWVLRQCFGLCGPLYDANVLYPHRDTLLFASPFLGQTVLMLPLYALGVSPATLYNSLLVLAVAISAAGAAMLGAELLKDRVAALVLLVVFGFYPARAVMVNHANLQFSFALPLALWGLYVFCVRGRVWAIYLTGLVVALQAYFSSQLVIWIGFGLAAAAPFFMATGHGWRTRRALAHWGGALVVSALAIGPLAWGYARMAARLGFERTMREAVNYAGTLKGLRNDRDLLRFDDWAWSRRADEVGHLGVYVLVAAGVGLMALIVLALRRERRPLVNVGVVGCLLVVLGAVFFLGPVAKEYGDHHLPFWWLRDLVPGLSGVRVPSRAIVLSALGAGMLASAGVAGLTRLLPWRLARVLLALVAAGALFVSLLPRPFSAQPVRQPSAAVDVIARLPEDAVVLPWPGFRAWNLQSMQNYDATFHGHTIVGGYRGIHSWLYNALYRELDSMPSPRALQVATAIGATHFVLDPRRLDPNRRAALSEAIAAGRLRGPVDQARGFEAYALPGVVPRRVGPDELRPLLPLAAAGPNRVAPQTLVTTALELPAAFTRPPRVEWRTAFKGEVWLRCAGQRYRSDVKYKVPGVVDQHRRFISAVWQTPAVEGRCEARFFAWETELGATSLTMDPALSGGRAAARVELLGFPSPAWPETAGELVVAISNTGARALPAHSDVQWPYAEGELKLECKFGGAHDGHLRTESEFNRGALPYDLLPGERIEVHLRMHTPRVAGSYDLRCRPLEFARGPIGERSASLNIDVVDEPPP